MSVNNTVIDRIRAQQSKNAVFNQIVKEASPKPNINPIPPEELKILLYNLFQVESSSQENKLKSEIYSFPDLFHWVEWYLTNKDKFNINQQRPLDTLVQAKDLINVGCACKRNQRFDAANNYFKTFWTNNLKNDLLPTILSILKVKSMQISDFLIFPPL